MVLSVIIRERNPITMTNFEKAFALVFECTIPEMSAPVRGAIVPAPGHYSPAQMESILSKDSPIFYVTSRNQCPVENAFHVAASR